MNLIKLSNSKHVIKLNNSEHVIKLSSSEYVCKSGSTDKVYSVYPFKGYCMCLGWRYSTPIKWCKHLREVYKKYFPKNYVLNKVLSGYRIFEPIKLSLFKLDELKTLADVNRYRDWWLSPKIDGIRVIWDAATMMFYSRTGNPIYTVRLLDKLIKTNKMPTDMNVEGELHFDDVKKTCMDVMSYKNSGMYVNRGDNIRLTLYDCLLLDDPDMLFEDRYSRLKGWYSNCEMDRVSVISFDKRVSLKQIESIRDKGYEGVVLRNPRARYMDKRAGLKFRFNKWSTKCKVLSVLGDGEVLVEDMKTGVRKIVQIKEHDSYSVGDVVSVEGNLVVGASVDENRKEKDK